MNEQMIRDEITEWFFNQILLKPDFNSFIWSLSEEGEAIAITVNP